MAERSSLICTNAIDLTKHIAKHNLVYQIPHKVSSLSIPLVCPKTQPLKKNPFHYLLLLSSLQPNEAQNRQLSHNFTNKGKAGKQIKHPAEEHPSGKH